MALGGPIRLSLSEFYFVFRASAYRLHWHRMCMYGSEWLQLTNKTKLPQRDEKKKERENSNKIK